MIKRIITGKLKTLTGFHIGSGERSETVDLSVFRNAEDEIIIPGTAIGGALRALATRIAPHLRLDKCTALRLPNETPTPKNVCVCPVCQLFGSIVIKEDTEEGEASKVWVYDAPLISDENISIRDGVGIDRETKSSARIARAKYDYEVVPKDSLFSLKIELQDDIGEDEEKILAAVLSEWSMGRGQLGGGVSRGLGNVELLGIEVYRIDFSNPDNLISFLKDEPLEKFVVKEKDWLAENLEKARKTIKQTSSLGDDRLYNSFAQIEFTLQFTGGFLVNDILNSTRTNYDFCPKLENGNFVLPGSSLKGVLRSQAEKIARSLATLHSKNAAEFLEKCPACNPHADENSPLSSCSALFRKQRKSPEEEIREEQLCLACRLFGSAYRGSRLYVRDAYTPLTQTTELKIMDFVAIDRFTGGAKEGAKFNALVLWQPAFKVSILLENPEEWQLGWLLLVLRDLKEGLMSVGFGQNKWFGKAETKDEKIKIGTISDAHTPTGLQMNDNNYEGVFKTKTWNLSDLEKEPEKPIETWVQKFNEKIEEFKRSEPLKSDTYFRDDTFELYPKEVEL